MSAWLRAAGLVLIGRRLRAVLSIGMVIGIGVVGTLALWSSTVNTRSGEFTTATVNILADGVKGGSFSFAPSGILPGQSAAKTVTVTNHGTAPFSYTASVSSDDALGQGVTLTVRSEATATSGGMCNGGNVITTNKPIKSTKEPFTTGPRPLAGASGTEILCLQLNLPDTASADLAGVSGKVMFTFDASAGT
ncbi:putative ribosomally synthesized peptide with SipW-like signal peptide [Williamsia limnetica]|uniref:Putative ribosomally synthesized peptide with SipW-like signal peptide n=1 Tax=Williamsia limnetica TaxID=882452 RepID=A0A318RI00_WILLI|nr:SipW-dependent-type signal peptide-containing protein [Williamsia limnetica]PYE14546.1 putative ribosomally synthesized peptide with SipW-like signal peptide [Williamsia limnetica]